MTATVDALGAAISETERLQKLLKKGRPRVQVTLSDERSSANATALAWFNNHRGAVSQAMADTDLKEVDDKYRWILEASARAGARVRYLATLKDLRLDLVRLRSASVSAPAKRAVTVDVAPDFTPLVSDPAMKGILLERWDECAKCLEAKVPLAATVMMGGLLEALLLARINKEANQKPIFTAKTAPRDKTGTTHALSRWTLNDYIAVVHEMTWITHSAKDIGAVLRDYRNYIHPQKQLSHGVRLTPDDASLFWEISKSIARQVIKSAP